jgi:hypothetical protein
VGSQILWSPADDAELLRLRHVEQRPWGYIASVLNSSRTACHRRYNKITEPESRPALLRRSSWQDQDEAELKRLSGEGKKPSEIAAIMGRSIPAVEAKLFRMRNYAPRVHHERASPATVVSQSALDDRNRRMMAQRSLTAQFFGDPEPGRSALDQRRLA